MSLTGENKTCNLCFCLATADPNARYVSFSCRGDKSNESPSAPFITELPIQPGGQKRRNKWQHRSLSDDHDHDGGGKAALAVVVLGDDEEVVNKPPN